MSDLKPCPFCGGNAELWRAQAGRTAWVACMGKCTVLVSKEYKTDEEAIAAWNRRADQPDLIPHAEVKALVDALKSALRFIENTESELGIVLGSGDKARAALKGGA